MIALRRLFLYALSHPLARKMPVRTFIRIVRWQVLSRLSTGTRDEPWIEGARLLVSRGMTGATGNLYFGLHEFADMAFVLHFLRPGDLFCDIGANVGSYTILAAKVVGADVLAIEPHPRTAAKLAANIAHNDAGSRVNVLQLALSDTVGTGTMTADLDTMNRLSGTDEGGSISVELTTLDALLEHCRPIMLKVDVEGHEPAVFSKAAATLAKSSLCAIEIETVDSAIVDQFTSAGFVEYFYDPFSRAISIDRNTIKASNRLFLRGLPVILERVVAARKFRIGRLLL